MFWNKNINIKNIMFGIVIIFLIWMIIQMKTIALLAFGSFVLACSLTPAVDKLSKKMKRSLASTIVIIGTFLVCILFLIPIITISIQEIHQLISNIPELINNTITFLSNKTVMGKTLIEFINIDTITNSTSQMASGVLNKSINFTMALMEMITIIVTMSVIVFYMINEKHLYLQDL